MKAISPSLSVYRIQVSSVFSILERITGLILFLFLLVIFYFIKLKIVFLTFYEFYNLYFLILHGRVESFLVAGILVFILLVFSYHFVFGLRYVLWDSYGVGSLLVDNLKYSVKIFLILSFIIFLFLLFCLF